MHAHVRVARALGLAGTLLAGLLTTGVATAPAASADSAWSGTLTQAISAIPVATEVRTGYSRDLFRHWVDADGDGCDTRREVLISEADTAPTVGSGCSLTGGRWYSYYDGVNQTDIADLDIDHMVPLAESWDSGSRSWTSARREAYANDMGDYRPLVAVTDYVNQAKGDQDPATWMPAKEGCRYIKEWVAVKIRWSLSQDSAEKSRLQSLAAGCTNTTISVTVKG